MSHSCPNRRSYALAVAGEQAVEPPEAGMAAVLVDLVHVHVALARPGLRAEDLRKVGLRGGVAVQDVVLAALLVVDDELDGDAGAARPLRIGRRLAVADEIARIISGHRWAQEVG